MQNILRSVVCKVLILLSPPCMYHVVGSAGKLPWNSTDGISVLSAGWSAPDYSQQHRTGASLRKAPL